MMVCWAEKMARDEAAAAAAKEVSVTQVTTYRLVA